MADYSSMTDEQLADALVNAKRAAGMLDAPSVESGFFQDIGGYLKEHGEIPGGIGGAIAGAAAGTAIMPGIGTIVGGVLGGATGSAGGSLASDAIMGNELDFGEAGKEAAISAAFDIGTFGAGKVLRPVARALGITDGGLTGLLRKKPEINVADEIVDMSKIKAGTTESKQLTQKFLTEAHKDGGLTAAQTGQGWFLRRVGQQLGEVGVLSSALTRRTAEANNEVIFSAIKDLAGDAMEVAAPNTTQGMGIMLHGAVEAGRGAIRSLMDDSVNALIKEHGGRVVSTKPIIRALVDFQLANIDKLSTKVSKNTLDKAQGLIDDLVQQSKVLTEAKTADLGSILSFEKSLQRDIQRAMPNSSFNDPGAVAELTQLKKAIQEGVTETLEKISPNAGATYRKINEDYSKAMTDLIPPTLGSVFALSNKDSFDALGKMLIGGTNQSSITKMMASLDVAYKKAREAKWDMSAVPAQNADAARRFIRQGYLEKTFSTVTEASDLTKFAGRAAQLSTPDALARSESVLGAEAFQQYKRILNAMQDTSTTGGTGLWGLAMRQKEMGAMGVMAAGASTGVGLMTAGLVLALPVVLSRLATNKQAVNHLLGLNTMVKRGLINDDNIAAALGKVFESLDDETKTDLRDYTRVN